MKKSVVAAMLFGASLCGVAQNADRVKSRPALDVFIENIPGLRDANMTKTVSFNNGSIGHVNTEYQSNPKSRIFVMIAGHDTNGNGTLEFDEARLFYAGARDTVQTTMTEALESRRFDDGSWRVSKIFFRQMPQGRDKPLAPTYRTVRRDQGIAAWFDMVNDFMPAHLPKRPLKPKPGLISL